MKDVNDRRIQGTEKEFWGYFKEKYSSVIAGVEEVHKPGGGHNLELIPKESPPEGMSKIEFNQLCQEAVKAMLQRQEVLRSRCN